MDTGIGGYVNVGIHMDTGIGGYADTGYDRGYGVAGILYGYADTWIRGKHMRGMRRHTYEGIHIYIYIYMNTGIGGYADTGYDKEYGLQEYVILWIRGDERYGKYSCAWRIAFKGERKHEI